MARVVIYALILSLCIKNVHTLTSQCMPPPPLGERELPMSPLSLPKMSFRHFSLLAIFSLVLLLAIAAMLLGFDANPSPRPQRVSDLVARLDALEEANAAQQEELDALDERVAALEAGGSGGVSMAYDEALPIPEAWVEADSSDGIVRYFRDSNWQLMIDEPGNLEMWVDDDNVLVFSWDWPYDLINDVRNDKEYLRIFENDMIWSDAFLRMNLERSGPIKFSGEDAYFWEISVESADGYTARMLNIFYECSELTTCNVSRTRYNYSTRNNTGVGEFSSDDWALSNLFARNVEFLSVDKAIVTANANLRECPAIDCEIVGRLVRGEIVEPVAVTDDGLWLQLRSGDWVSSRLVLGAPPNLPVIQSRDAM